MYLISLLTLVTLEPALLLINKEIFVYNALILFLGKQSLCSPSVIRLEPDLHTTGKETHFHDVFIIILGKQSVSSSYVIETRARSSIDKEKIFLMMYL